VKITGTIITLNEEKNLPRCLQSLALCDEVVVVDSGSNDRTVEVAAQAGAKVLRRDWTGYADQKNYAAESASNDWILSLDADEELSEALRSEILAIKESELDVAGFRFPRRAHYLGKWINHSGSYPDRKIRLYDRRRARWVGDYVHESVVTNEPITELNGDLLHYTCDTFANHMKSLDRYTDLAAQELADRGQRVGWGRLLIDPPFTFVKTFLLKRGFLDGTRGLAISYAAALYVYSKYAKARALQAGR
jgi:glycosyltransferase involved in cell wall biosynthesis